MINYRSKKQEQSILIEADSGIQLDTQNHQIKMYPTFLNGPIKYHIRSSDRNKKFVPDVQYDCRLIRDTSGRFYLNIPCHVVPCDNQAGNIHVKNEWVSLDPGVRTFQTIYSPQTGIAYKIGQGDISRIYRLCLRLDQLISQREKGFSEKIKGQINHRTIKKCIEKLRRKIKHVIDEIHWKTIHFLLSNFSHIIIPIFKVQEMVNRTTRKINKKVVRQMINWRHYTFRQRLISSANRMGKKVYVVGEEYSSKTCGSCLQIDEHLGGKKIYKCPHCNVQLLQSYRS
jgi:putative transposase